MTTPRKISVIAHDILTNWSHPYFAARPYLHAMASLENITDKFGGESAKDIVLYFLSNASAFKGEHARRLKAELNFMLTPPGAIKNRQ